MKQRRAAAIVAMAAILYAVGCSLFVDTTGLIGELPAESGSDGPDDRSVGVEVDTSTTAMDAGRVCEATFCDDFDETPLGERWTSKELVNGGAFELGTPALSAPNALRTHFAEGGVDDRRSALLELDLGLVTHVRCDFAMFVEVRPQVERMDVFRIRTSSATLSNYNILFGVNPGSGGSLREDVFDLNGSCTGCPRRELDPPTFATGRWARVTLEFDFANVTLSYDGVVVSAGAFGGFKPTSNVFVAVGSLAYVADVSVVLVDDFSCTASP